MDEEERHQRRQLSSVLAPDALAPSPSQLHLAPTKGLTNVATSRKDNFVDMAPDHVLEHVLVVVKPLGAAILTEIGVEAGKVGRGGRSAGVGRGTSMMRGMRMRG